jgi:hypothetical protein
VPLSSLKPAEVAEKPKKERKATKQEDFC